MNLKFHFKEINFILLINDLERETNLFVLKEKTRFKRINTNTYLRTMTHG